MNNKPNWLAVILICLVVIGTGYGVTKAINEGLGATVNYSTAGNYLPTYTLLNAMVTDLQEVRKPLSGLLTGTVNFNVQSLGAGGAASTTATVTGAGSGDLVFVTSDSTSSVRDKLRLDAYVSAADTVTLIITNTTSTLDESNQNYFFRVLPKNLFIAPAALTTATTTTPNN